MGEIIIFAKHGGGNVPKQGKQREIRNLWSMTKKRSAEIEATLENPEIFREKGKIFEIFKKVRKFSENRGKSETEGKCIMASGGWTPLNSSNGVATSVLSDMDVFGEVSRVESPPEINAFLL